MWFFVVILIAVLITYWQATLVFLIGIGALMAFCRWALKAGTEAESRPRLEPEYCPQPHVQTRPIARDVRVVPKLKPKPPPGPPPMPVRELQAPDYLPRWTPRRRQAEALERAQWQDAFER